MKKNNIMIKNKTLPEIFSINPVTFISKVKN